MKKSSPTGSVVDLLLLGGAVFSGVDDFKSHDWAWVAMWIGIVLFFIWGIPKSWAWAPEDKDQNQDKTNQIRKIWKRKS